MATKKYEAVATIGEYKNRNGETKKRYLNVGTVFENENGQLSLKLDAVPVGQEWSGWISFFDPKPRDANPMGGTDRTAAEATRRPSPATQANDEATDIPF